MTERITILLQRRPLFQGGRGGRGTPTTLDSRTVSEAEAGRYLRIRCANGTYWTIDPATYYDEDSACIDYARHAGETARLRGAK